MNRRAFLKSIVVGFSAAGPIAALAAHAVTEETIVAELAEIDRIVGSAVIKLGKSVYDPVRDMYDTLHRAKLPDGRRYVTRVISTESLSDTLLDFQRDSVKRSLSIALQHERGTDKRIRQLWAQREA